MRIDIARMGRLVLAGAIAGIVIFIVFNPGLVKDEEKIMRLATSQIFDFDKAMHALEDLKSRFTTPDPFGAFMFTGSFAAMIGGLLVIVDEMSTRLRRVLRKALLAAVYGIVIGGSLGMGIDFLCTRLARINLLFIALAGVFGWPLIGLAAGASVGLTFGTWRRAMLAMIGGLVGGFIGGQVFEGIGSIASLATGNGSIGRALAFPLMGAAIGLAVAIVEEAGKQSWVTVLNGAKEGRQYILSKSVTTIGRDELADIPLFGDPTVAKKHADLALMGYLVTLQKTGGNVEVNGHDVQSVQLNPLDTIRIGRHLLRFHQRGERQLARAQQYVQQPYGLQVPPPQPMPGPPAPTIIQSFPTAGALTLIAVSGPHMNQRFQFTPGTVTIGREADHGILLAMDTIVSRTHAEITWTGSNWLLRDLHSTNGVWMNGARIAEHPLALGDQFAVGETWLRVEGL